MTTFILLKVINLDTGHARRNILCAALQVITASKRNFLRVDAQMYNLDTQKTYACLQNVTTHRAGRNFIKTNIFCNLDINTTL